MSSDNLKSMVLHSIGGGWGKTSQDQTHTERVTIIRGTDIPKIKSGDYSSLPIRFETKRRLNTRQLQAGDIVIEVSGGSAASGQHTGRAVLITERILKSVHTPIIPASFCRLLRLDSQKIDPAYVVNQIESMHLSGKIGQFERQSTGISNFQFKYFIQAVRPLISSNEAQKSISRFFGLLDDRITLLRETSKTLEAIAQAIFKSWFVDFDPVHAKVEGRTPEGMDDETAALFPDEFEKSELGLVPEGWELVPFGELLTKTIGGDWGSEHPTSTNKVEIAIIRGTDIPDLSYGGKNRVPVRYTTEKKMRSRKLQAGDIVIEISGGSKKQPTGRSILISNELLSRFNSHVVPASFCRLFRPTNIPIGVMLAEHLKLLYEQGLTWNYQNQSTGIANFQTKHFLKSELVIKPPKQLIHAFFEIVYPLVNKTQTQKILTLEKLRDTLLPRLISGKLRLPEAESLVEEVI